KVRGGRRATPAQLKAQGVKLFSMRRSGGSPLLGASVRDQHGGAGFTSPTISKLRRGAQGKKGEVQAVPLFFGLQTVTLRKRFQVGALAGAVSSQIPTLLSANLKRIGG